MYVCVWEGRGHFTKKGRQRALDRAGSIPSRLPTHINNRKAQTIGLLSLCAPRPSSTLVVFVPPVFRWSLAPFGCPLKTCRSRVGIRGPSEAVPRSLSPCLHSIWDKSWCHMKEGSTHSGLGQKRPSLNPWPFNVTAGPGRAGGLWSDSPGPAGHCLSAQRRPVFNADPSFSSHHPCCHGDQKQWLQRKGAALPALCTTTPGHTCYWRRLWRGERVPGQRFGREWW